VLADSESQAQPWSGHGWSLVIYTPLRQHLLDVENKIKVKKKKLGNPSRGTPFANG